MNRHPDVAVLGAGIIGCAAAWVLAREGRRVVVLDRGEIGREASWAAGGVLTPVHLAEYPGPLSQLCLEAQRAFEPFLSELSAQDRADIEYRITGMLLPILDDRDERDAATLEEWKRRNGQPVERLDAVKTREGEPVVSSRVRGALLLPDIAQVRNHRLTRALARAAARAGAEFRTGSEVTGFLRVPGRVTGVKTSQGDLYAGHVVVATGAWSGGLLESLGVRVPVRPVRGQMVLLEGPAEVLRRMILRGDTYLIPRADGQVLVGSTVEEAGFDASPTLEGIRSLLERAVELAPGVRDFRLVRTWAGLRPGTPDRLPHIGRPAGFDGLVIATGHYRNGILLAPLTARLVADLIAGRSPALDLTPFRPDR